MTRWGSLFSPKNNDYDMFVDCSQENSSSDPKMVLVQSLSTIHNVDVTIYTVVAHLFSNASAL